MSQLGRKTYCTNSTLCIVREAIYLHSSYSNCVVYRVVNLFIPLKFFFTSCPDFSCSWIFPPWAGGPVAWVSHLSQHRYASPPGVRFEGDHINKSCLVSPLFPIYASEAHISVYGRRSNTILRIFSIGAVPPPLHGNNPQNSTWPSP